MLLSELCFCIFLKHFCFPHVQKRRITVTDILSVLMLELMSLRLSIKSRGISIPETTTFPCFWKFKKKRVSSNIRIYFPFIILSKNCHFSWGLFHFTHSLFLFCTLSSMYSNIFHKTNSYSSFNKLVLPRWLTDKRICLEFRRHGFYPWIGKILWRRKWQPTWVFWPRKSHGQKSLALHGAAKESDMTLWLNNNKDLEWYLGVCQFLWFLSIKGDVFQKLRICVPLVTFMREIVLILILSW